MSDRFRARRHNELRALLDRSDVTDAIAEFGTPLLFLDVESVRLQYRRLAQALPGVRLHYAVKALTHPAVIDALRDEGGCFDVASLDELDVLTARGVGAPRVRRVTGLERIADWIRPCWKRARRRASGSRSPTGGVRWRGSRGSRPVPSSDWWVPVWPAFH